jgi:hypothetical protein
VAALSRGRSGTLARVLVALDFEPAQSDIETLCNPWRVLRRPVVPPIRIDHASACAFARKAVRHRPARKTNPGGWQAARIGRAVPGDAIIHRYKSKMDRGVIKFAVLCACLWLPGCAGGRTVGEHIADMPPWLGGLPADAPPRRGSPEYDAWMAKRAQEAERPKTEQQPK